jgi:polysaccharide export outer membrane protein
MVDYEKILEGTATDFPLQPGDILYVPSNVMGTWNEVLEQLLPTLKTASSIMNPWLMSMSLQNSNGF